MPYRVLFVCLGNICRSPLAEGIFREKVRQAGLKDRIEIDSAGTGAWHQGEPPDPRSCDAAAAHGIQLTGHARKVLSRDFAYFDQILAMDLSNYDELFSICPPEHRHKLKLMRDYDDKPHRGKDVPDPYYGGTTGFDKVYTMLDRCCTRALAELQSRLQRSREGTSG